MSSPSSSAAIVSQHYSDLVQDSKLETEFLGSCVQHVFYGPGRTAHERRVRRVEQWARQSLLGRGAYGIVYLEKCITDNTDGHKQRQRAVKEVLKCVATGEELDYVRELEAIAKFSNPNYAHCFVTSQGWFETNDTVFITMEYLVNGDLQRYLTQPLPEVEARQITAQVLEGLRYMHENNFVHRDLKPTNIMVVNKGPDWFVKIADFGISKRRQQDVTTLHTLQRGTFGFAAPEVFGFARHSPYTFSVDMWSLGAVAYRMLTNATPFPTMADISEYVFQQIEFPTALLETHQVSKTGVDLILALMASNPKDRLTAVSAGRHEWLSGRSADSSTQLADNEIPSLDPIVAVEEASRVTIASNVWSTDENPGPQAISLLRAVTVRQTDHQPMSVLEHLEEKAVLEGAMLSIDSPGLSDEAGSATSSSDVGSFRKRDTIEELEHTHTSRESDASDNTSGESQYPVLLSTPEKSMVEPTQGLSPHPTAAYSDDDEREDTEYFSSDGEQYEASCDAGDKGQKEREQQQQQEEQGEGPRSTGHVDEEHDASEPTGSALSAATAATEMKTSAWESQTITGQCHWCSRQSSPVNSLSCGHAVCYSCLSQSFALSLISPKCMPPICCAPIEMQHLKQLSDFSPVMEPWTFMYQFTIKMRKATWICPNGHVGHPKVSTNKFPTWNRRVACGVCRTPNSNGRAELDYFCLFCREKSCMGYCVRQRDEAINAFVDSNIVPDPTGNSAALQSAYLTREAINRGECSGWEEWEDVKNEPLIRRAWEPSCSLLTDDRTVSSNLRLTKVSGIESTLSQIDDCGENDSCDENIPADAADPVVINTEESSPTSASKAHGPEDSARASASEAPDVSDRCSDCGCLRDACQCAWRLQMTASTQRLSLPLDGNGARGGQMSSDETLASGVDSVRTSELGTHKKEKRRDSWWKPRKRQPSESSASNQQPAEEHATRRVEIGSPTATLALSLI
ncbi:hypothetical protein PG989_000524 [Apiospora arundinis]